MSATSNLSNQRTARREAEMAAFGEALGSAMRARGMTQVELAEALDVTQSMVSVWRNGQYECPHDIVFECERILSVAPGTLSIRAGYLPPEIEHGGPSTVYDAVLADGLLSVRSRETMLALYDHLVNAEAPTPKPVRKRTNGHQAKAGPSRPRRATR